VGNLRFRALAGRVRTTSPSSITQLMCLSLPPVVEDAVFGALAKDPAHRFAIVQDG